MRREVTLGDLKIKGLIAEGHVSRALEASLTMSWYFDDETAAARLEISRANYRAGAADRTR